MSEKSKVIIRQLGLSDLEILTSWRMEVLDEVFGAEAVDATGREGLELANRDYYQRELAAGTHVACAAQVDGEIVGCGGICIQEEMPSPDNPSGKCAYLMNIYTRPAFQQRGVGRAVVSWLLEAARDVGAQKIYLEASDAGRALYGKAGFRDMAGMMIYEEEALR